MKKSRSFCFTVNNYNESDCELLENIDCRYIVYGKEVGALGTPHLQGYIYFSHARSFNSVKAELPTCCHIEVAKGTAEQNKNYCEKDGLVYERGDLPKSSLSKGESERERWRAAREAAKEGRFDEVDADIFMRCYRTLKEVRKDYMVNAPDLNTVAGLWIYGEAGVGKSRTARAKFGGARNVEPGGDKVVDQLFLKQCNKWWDGYRDQRYVLIDDFDKSHHVLGHYLKIWSDRYSFNAESKGSCINIRPRLIIVTSQYHPDDIWLDAETRAAIKRRFKIVEKFLLGERVTCPEGYIDAE